MKTPKKMILALASSTTLTMNIAKFLAPKASPLLVFLWNIKFKKIDKIFCDHLILKDVSEKVIKLRTMESIFQSTKFVTFCPPLKIFNRATIKVGMKYKDW